MSKLVYSKQFCFPMYEDDWKKFDAVVAMARQYVERYSPGLEIDREAVEAMSEISDAALCFYSGEDGPKPKRVDKQADVLNKADPPSKESI